jgi:hypothetical protein
MDRQKLADLLARVANEAVHEVVQELTSAEEVDLGNVNQLSWIGQAISREIRRRILLEVAEISGWSPKAMAPHLGMHDNSAVLRALRALRADAPDEYAAARRDGRIKVGGRRC